MAKPIKDINFNELVKEAGRILQVSDGLITLLSRDISKDNLKGEKSFKLWFKSNFVSIPFYLTVILSIGIIYFGHIAKSFSAQSIKSFAYTYEAGILLLIILHLALFTKSIPHSHTNKMVNRGLAASRDFLRYWTYLWVSWFFLYIVLVINSYESNLFPDYGFRAFLDGCNNLSGVVFFSMFYELSEETQDKVGRQDQPWLVGILLVVVLFVLELLVLKGVFDPNHNPTNDPDHPQAIKYGYYQFCFSLSYGLLIGVLTGLFVGRLESIIFNLHPFFVVYFILYAVVQPTFAFLQSSNHQYDDLSLVLLIIALYGKVFMLIAVHWIRDTDRLLYYMVRRYRTTVQENKMNFRQVFLTVVNWLDQQSGEDPETDPLDDKNVKKIS